MTTIAVPAPHLRRLAPAETLARPVVGSRRCRKNNGPLCAPLGRHLNLAHIQSSTAHLAAALSVWPGGGGGGALFTRPTRTGAINQSAARQTSGAGQFGSRRCLFVCEPAGDSSPRRRTGLLGSGADVTPFQVPNGMGGGGGGWPAAPRISSSSQDPCPPARVPQASGANTRRLTIGRRRLAPARSSRLQLNAGPGCQTAELLKLLELSGERDAASGACVELEVKLGMISAPLRSTARCANHEGAEFIRPL